MAADTTDQSEGCPRCRKNTMKHQGRCDVGIKALFRAIRRCCIQELENVKKQTANETEMKESLVKHLLSMVGDRDVAEELALLITAFALVSHVPQKWRRNVHEQRQEVACSLVQTVCY